LPERLTPLFACFNRAAVYKTHAVDK
jgi:hypothetical protein